MSVWPLARTRTIHLVPRGFSVLHCGYRPVAAWAIGNKSQERKGQKKNNKSEAGANVDDDGPNRPYYTLASQSHTACRRTDAD